MSRENVEVVRSAYDAFNRGDWDAAFRDMHPDFEFAMQHAPNPGPHRGRKEARAHMEDGLAAYEAFSREVDDLREGGEQVVALIRVRVRPNGTTAEIENRVGHLRSYGIEHTFASERPRRAAVRSGRVIRQLSDSSYSLRSCWLCSR